MLTRYYNAFRGFLLLLRYTRRFDTGMLKGKRIAIVGPASSAYQTNRGAYIDGFDYVIRINKAPLLLKDGKYDADIGRKLDILFHSFFENDFSGGGPLDFELYDRLGIKYVINPIPTFFGKRVTFNFYKKYLLPRVVYGLAPEPYQEAVKAFGRFRPTTSFLRIEDVRGGRLLGAFYNGFYFLQNALWKWLSRCAERCRDQ